jgi:hypothetical protein
MHQEVSPPKNAITTSEELLVLALLGATTYTIVQAGRMRAVKLTGVQTWETLNNVILPNPAHEEPTMCWVGIDEQGRQTHGCLSDINIDRPAHAGRSNLHYMFADIDDAFAFQAIAEKIWDKHMSNQNFSSFV